MFKSFFEKTVELKDKFKSLLCHKKKVQALENYSECSEFHHRDYLALIKRCMKDGFLQQKESDFLSYMVDKYEINFLEWAHKTKWLKKHMEARKIKPEPKRASQQLYFDFEKTQKLPNISVPIELLVAQQKQHIGVR